jgi:SAM-dependent methyltransferase
MATAAAAFTGSIPEIYDRYLGPVLFEPYARDLAARLAPPVPPRVLEVACGSGVATRQLRERLAPEVELVASDLHEAMFAVARSRLGAGARVEWQAADAQALPFPDAHFGAWVCQFGWMFFPDKPRAAGEAFRVLRPGGQLLLSVWGALHENPLAQIVDATLARCFPRDPPDFYRVPFGFHDTQAIVAMLRGAGFAGAEAASVDCEARAPSAEHAAIGFVRGNPVVAEIHARGADPDSVVAEVAAALRRELGPDPLRAPMRAHVVAARRP